MVYPTDGSGEEVSK